MRNLTIKREKSFVACLAKMKVYIEDYITQDLEINGVPCRKLGELKNGEEKTFTIEDREAKVFVIADKLSKGFCSDFYSIPEGTDDIFLSGKNKYNPINGNAFRFDGVASEEVAKNRKKGLKIGIVILIISFILGIVLGVISGLKGSGDPKEFINDDFSITLTDAFSEISFEDFTYVFDSSDCAVFVVEDSFEYFADTEVDTLEEYAQLLIEVNEFDDSTVVKKQGDLIYYVYEGTDSQTNQSFAYTAFVYEGTDSFWLVQFAVPEENAEEKNETVFQWAETVVVE